MTEVRRSLRDVKISHISLHFYQFLFDCIICLIGALIVTRILSLPIFYTVIPFLAFFVIATLVEFHEWNIVKVIMKAYSHLDEKLQTALEVQPGNPIAEDLMYDVSREIDDISDTTFVKPKSLAKRVMAIFTLSFLLLTLGYLGYFYGTIEKIIEDNTGKGIGSVGGIGGSIADGFQSLMGNQFENSSHANKEEQDRLGAKAGGETPGISEGPLPGEGGGTGVEGNYDIYGDASSAGIDGTDIDLELRPEYGGSIEIRETGESQVPDYYLPGDAQAAEACRDCQVGPEHEELVRNYFQKLIET